MHLKRSFVTLGNGNIELQIIIGKEGIKSAIALQKEKHEWYFNNTYEG